MNPTYRGLPVDSVHYDRRADRYELYSSDGDIIGELKRVEFLSQPQLRSLRQTNGRYRKSYSQVYSRAVKQSSVAINWRTFSAITTAGAWFAFDSPEPEPIAHSGIRAGEIIAPRAWRVEGDRLFSIYMKDEWLPGKPIQGDPRDKKNHGVHAFKDRGSVINYLLGRTFEHRMLDDLDVLKRHIFGDASAVRKPDPQFVTGAVAMWGEIVEHERGWRGEFGRVESIDYAFDSEFTSHNTLQKLRARYGLSTDQKVRALLNGGAQ